MTLVPKEVHMHTLGDGEPLWHIHKNGDEPHGHMVEDGQYPVADDSVPEHVTITHRSDGREGFRNPEVFRPA